VDTDPGAVSQEILDYVGFEPMGHSALEIINGIFENDHVRALLLFHISICGFDVADKAPNYQPIWFLANLTNWHLCRGGSHYLTHAAGGAFLRMGGELIEQAHVSKINIEDGKAAGVEMQDGRKIRARKAVVSSVDLEQTFIDMIDAEHLDTELTDKVKAFRYDACNNVLFGGHLALKEPARYLAAKDNPDIDRCFNMNVGYETPADIIEHIDEVKANELPKTPRLNAGCNTLFDPTQAPPGYHTGVLWQFVPFNVDDKPGEYWLDIQEEYLDRCLHEWAKYAPNMQGDNILGRYVHSPWHIDRMLINMRGGNFNVGSTMASQAGDDRPMPELSGYDTPIDQLYLCGSCCKDQGGITGLTPWGALLRIAEDLDLKEKLGLR
jgi:phytoene dehydrogenase-like protein